jgi:cytochrome c556
MAAHRFGDPMTGTRARQPRWGVPVTDGDIDSTLATALAVEPSPEFLARVRMRIASEPDPSDWRFSWVFAAGACTIAIVIAVSVMHMNHPVFSPGLPPKSIGDLSLLPALLPGPFAIAASGTLRARREKPSPEMQAAMKSNAATMTALAAHIKEKKYDAIVRDAATLRQNFAGTEAFWAERRMGAAVNLTRSGLHALADLEAAALANDDRAIEKAAAAVTGTCEACHKQHREQLPDNSYEIRL